MDKSQEGSLMMRVIRNAVLFTGFVALVGCSTTPISVREAVQVPSQCYKQPSPDAATVVVIRDAGLMGAACATEVLVDGQVVGEVRAGEKLVLYVPAGDIILGAQPRGICAGNLVEIEARLTRQKHAFFRIGMNQNGSMGLYRTVPR